MMKLRTWLTAGLLASSPAAAQVPMGGSGASPTTLATIPSSGSAQTLAFASVGNAAYDVTLTGNTAFSLSGGTVGQFQSITLVLRESGLGGYVPSLPSSIQWAAGSPPVIGTQAGTATTVILSTSDGGKTIEGLAGGVPIGTVAGTARDAAAGIAAELAAATASTTETIRAEAAEATLLPKATTTLAGLSVAASPSAAQLASALPAFSAIAPGVVPVPPLGGSNLVLGQGGWTMATGGGNVSTDTAGTISGQVLHVAAGPVNRTLLARASDTFNVRDFGAVGNGTATAIGTTYGSSLAAMASYTTTAGVQPFTWVTNPLFGLTFTMTTTSAQSGVGTTLQFGAPLSSTWSASYVAPWQMPINGNFLLRPGMLVSGTGIAAGTTVASLPSIVVRQGELQPALTTADTWTANTAYAVGQVRDRGGNSYIVSSVTGNAKSGSAGPTGTSGTSTDGNVTWSYIAAISTAPETMWAAGATVSAGQIMWANGGHWMARGSGTAGATAPGSNAASGTEAFSPTISASSSDGTISWAWLLPAEYTNLPSGAVTLSTTTIGAVGNSVAVTFTIAPGQLQALTLDWLGIQTAVAQAYGNPSGAGGEVYMPAGLYEPNHSLLNPGQTADTAAGTPAVIMRGDGRTATQLQFITDLGQDECAVAESNRGPGWNSISRYEDFRIFGPGNYTSVNGVSPNKMDGLCIGEIASAYRLTINNARAGINLVNDHQIIRDYSGTSNGYSLLFAPYSNSIGNQEISGGGLFGFVAGVGIASTNQFDSGLMSNVHTGFGPYGFYSMPGTPNVSFTGNYAVTNSTLNGVWTESIGAAWMRGSQPGSQFNGNTLINTDGGMAQNAQYSLPNGVGATLQPRAEIDVMEFIDNTMIGTNMNAYSVVSDAIIEASGAGGCANNEWVNDPFFIVSATLNIPMIKCVYNTGNNVFHNGFGDGIIVPFTGAVAANTPVGDRGNVYGPYTEGQGFAGISVVAIAAGNAGPIMTHSVGTPALTATASQTINAGTLVFVTGTPSPGVAPAIDPADAIGTAQIGGTGLIGVALEPLESRGSAKPDTGETAPAPGTVNAANCYAIKSPVTEFSTVPSGGCATLALTPISKSETIYNDGASALAVLPPAGSSIGTLASNSPISLAAGATATYFRLSATQWH